MSLKKGENKEEYVFEFYNEKKIKISLGISGRTKGKLKKHYKNPFE